MCGMYKDYEKKCRKGKCVGKRVIAQIEISYTMFNPVNTSVMCDLTSHSLTHLNDSHCNFEIQFPTDFFKMGRKKEKKEELGCPSRRARSDAT